MQIYADPETNFSGASNSIKMHQDVYQDVYQEVSDTTSCDKQIAEMAMRIQGVLCKFLLLVLASQRILCLLHCHGRRLNPMGYGPQIEIARSITYMQHIAAQHTCMCQFF